MNCVERPIGHDGMNANERLIMQLWDAGLTNTEIITETGLKRAYVKATLAAFTHDASGDRAFVRAAREASLALAAACAATGSSFR